MKKIIKITLSFIFITLVVLISSRIFILNKLETIDFEGKIRSVAKLYLDDIKLSFDSLEFNVTTKINLKLKSLHFLSTKDNESLLSIEGITLSLPISAMFNNKAKANTKIDKIIYSKSRGNLLTHLKNPTQDIDIKEHFPKFITKIRNSFKVKQLFYGDQSLGRLNLKNLKYKGSTAFELKQKQLDLGELRIVGNFYLSDLIEKHQLNLKSSFEWKGIKNLKDSIKGRILTNRDEEQLKLEVSLTANESFDCRMSISFDKTNYYFNEVEGTLQSKVIDSSLLNKVDGFDISFSGDAHLNRKTFKLNPMIKFKSLKNIIRGDFTHSFNGILKNTELAVNVESRLNSSEIKTRVFADIEIAKLLVPNFQFEELRINVQGSKFSLSELKKLRSVKLESITNDLKLSFDFVDLSSASQVFKFSGQASLSEEVFMLEELTLKETTEGRVLGTFSHNLRTNALYFDFGISKLKLDFLEELVKSSGFLLKGKFSGTINGSRGVGEKLRTTYILDGESGLIERLGLFLPFDDLSSGLKFNRFEKLRLNLELEDKLVKFNLFDFENKTEKKFLSLIGQLHLNDEMSKLNGVVELDDRKVPFVATGMGIKLSLKRINNE